MVTPALASEIFKSVDQYGNVTYSSTAPDSDQNTEVLPEVAEPTEADIQDANQRLKKLVDSLKQPVEQNVDSSPQTSSTKKKKEQLNTYPTKPNYAPLFAPFF